MSNDFCPHGHELNADGTCSRDGYVKPVEVAPETLPETPEELGNDQVNGNTPDSPLTGSSETSGLPTDTPPTEPVAPTETAPVDTTVTPDQTPTETQPTEPAATI